MTIEEIEECIIEYGNDIYRFCRHLTCNKDLADDLYQECFLVAMQKNDSSTINNKKNYILSIAANLWRNEWRKQKRRQEIAFPTEYDGEIISDENISVSTQSTDIQESYIDKETKKLLIKIVSKLPDKYRIVVSMHYGEDMSTTDIAKALHISKGTVTSRLYRARKIIKDSMEEYGYED